VRVGFHPDNEPQKSQGRRVSGFLCKLCALRSALCVLGVLGVASFALLQPAHYHTYFAGT